jgi:hypothetical protein
MINRRFNDRASCPARKSPKPALARKPPIHLPASGKGGHESAKATFIASVRASKFEHVANVISSIPVEDAEESDVVVDSISRMPGPPRGPGRETLLGFIGVFDDARPLSNSCSNGVYEQAA